MKYNDNKNWTPPDSYGYISSRKTNKERRNYFVMIKKFASIPFLYLLSECFNENHKKEYYDSKYLFKELYKENSIDNILNEMKEFSIINETEKNNFKRKYIISKLLK
jgi:hypothetical protein